MRNDNRTGRRACVRGYGRTDDSLVSCQLSRFDFRVELRLPPEAEPVDEAQGSVQPRAEAQSRTPNIYLNAGRPHASTCALQA
jgi:hypothetical protein